MYNLSIQPKQRIFANITYQGQSIEEKMREVTEKQEPIEMTAEMIYTERNEGVLPGYDIRTDRFEIAIDAADKINAMYAAKNKENAPGEGEPGAGEPGAKTE